MTPSEQCKAAGLKSLNELSMISGASTRTLINWHRDKPTLFATTLAGAARIKLEIITPENKCPACQGTGRVKP